MKFVRFIVDAGGSLQIPPIPESASEYSAARDAVARALANERTVTEQIYRLVDIATEDSNYMAVRFLDWFVNEQFEEVSTMSALLSVVRRAGDGNLLQVEDYLARHPAPHGDETTA
jgi:ferritin